MALNWEQNYLNQMQNVLDNGSFAFDRTGVGTYSTFGTQMHIDLSQGFPAVTTKKLAFKSVVSELLWFLEGSTDERRLAEIQYGKPREELIGKNTIWTANADAQGKALGYENSSTTKLLGNVYGNGWRFWETNGNNIELVPYPTKSTLTPVVLEKVVEHSGDDFVGKIVTKGGTDFLVFDKIIQKPNSIYRLQSLVSGIVFEISRPNLRTNQIKALVFGVASSYLPKGYDKPNYYDRAYHTWYNMIARCYNPAHPSYNIYGGSGVTVSNRWLNLYNFLNDIPNIAGFTHWLKGGYDIDKDYHGGMEYSKELCVFIPHEINCRVSNTKKYTATMPSGERIEFLHPKSFSKKMGLPKTSVATAINENRPLKYKTGIITFTMEEAPTGYFYRLHMFVDQISWVINEIKHNPNSRRLIVNAYNVAELDTMALPPCHTMFQFNVNNGKLDCMLLQRSADLFLGSPFNIASYALLVYMIAQVTGLTPGTFVYTIGNAHIYANHVEQVREQLTRTPYAPPKLVMNPDVKDIFSFKMEDFSMEGYQSHPTIKAPMAV